MAKLILQTILFVALISALYGAPQNYTNPQHDSPSFATLDLKPAQKSPENSSSEETNIRPARAAHHDGTDHDHEKDDHPSVVATGAVKTEEHNDHGSSSTTPKIRAARATENEEKHEDSHGHDHSHPATLTKDEHDQKQEASTSAKPRALRAAETEEKHEEAHDHTHHATSTKQHDPKQEGSTSAKPRTARATENYDEANKERQVRGTEEETKWAVHDQPIPVPPTLKDPKHEETKQTEEKKETPKEKRETDERKDHPESPSSYAKIPSGQEQESVSLTAPNKESEYDRHVRETNDQSHGQPLLLNKESGYSHGIQTPHKDDSSSSSSSSEEDKSNDS